MSIFDIHILRAAWLDAAHKWLVSHPWLVTAALIVSLLSLLVGATVGPWLLIRLPADYFMHERAWRDHLRSPAAFILMVTRNVVGVFLIGVGIALLFLPGQGLLTLGVGIGVLDVPGRRRLAAWLLRRPTLRRLINRIRRRAGRPPLELPERFLG